MTGQDVFAQDHYVIRRKVLQIFGSSFHLNDATGSLVGFSRQKAFKLKEDIRLYMDETCTSERLAILARQMLDFSPMYDVIDAQAQQPVGTLRRRGFKSILQDEWTIIDAQGREIGLIREDSLPLALLRRYLSNLIPQTFHATVGDTQVATFRQNFNPFVRKLAVEIHPAAQGLVDRRLLLAGAVLLVAIEGRQQ